MANKDYKEFDDFLKGVELRIKRLEALKSILLREKKNGPHSEKQITDILNVGKSMLHTVDPPNTKEH